MHSSYACCSDLLHFACLCIRRHNLLGLRRVEWVGLCLGKRCSKQQSRSEPGKWLHGEQVKKGNKEEERNERFGLEVEGTSRSIYEMCCFCLMA